jgi:type II secretory pathway pseudopilin PulG
MSLAEPPLPDAGFTLVETLAAFAILSAGTAALLAALSGGIVASTRAAEVEEAVSLARSALDRVGRDVPVAVGRHALEAPEDVEVSVWVMRVEGMQPTADAAGLFEVRVRVLDGATGEVAAELATLRAVGAEIDDGR